MAPRVLLLALLFMACGTDPEPTPAKDASVGDEGDVAIDASADEDPGPAPDLPPVEDVPDVPDVPEDLGPQCADGTSWCEATLACDDHCCPVDAPTWCHPVWSVSGFCAGPNADCAQAKSCDGKTLVACDQGTLANCTAAGALACCGGDTPLWCEPGSSKVAGFPGACLPPASVCSTVGKDGLGGWSACQPGDAAGLTPDGLLVCCTGGDAYCPAGSGTAGDYPGTACVAVDTNCASLTKLPDGAWASCATGHDFGVIQSTGALVCCDDGAPLFCGSAFVADGDLAYQNSIKLKAEVTTCTQECKVDADCPAWPKPEAGVVSKCKGPANTACNQCVLDPQNGINQSLTPGGCFPAPVAGTTPAEQCADVYAHLILCAGKLEPCTSGACYCWKDTVFSPY